jgi:multidrug efflux system membrane fusion protein
MNRSSYLAIFLLAILSIWMLSGALNEDQEQVEQSNAQAKGKQPMRVKVEDLYAKEITQEIVLQGTLEPLREVEIRSQLNTTVAHVVAIKGAVVEVGEPLVRLNIGHREALVKQAEADVTQFSLEVDAAKKLLGKGLNSETLLRSAEANLARAKAELEAAQIGLSFTKISAPFAGVWEERFVEKGSHVDVGQRIGRLVDNSIVKAVGFVSQQSVNELTMGQPVSVTLLDGRNASGILTYIANVGDEQTQSFRIEADIDNSTRALHAGASAEIRIETGSQLAHFVSPSAFSLGQDGKVGIKSVDKDGVVQFYPVELVRKDLDGVWVTGLPQTLTLITLGQGFVSTGELVTAVRG